jgi:hypothetical protein
MRDTFEGVIVTATSINPGIYTVNYNGGVSDNGRHALIEICD